MNLVFVYGTLRTDMPLYNTYNLKKYITNHGLFKLKGYDMYSLGTYPAVVKGYGEIVGELFEFNSEYIKQVVDFIESQQYNQKIIKVNLDGNDREAIIYVYKSNPFFLNKQIPNGDWVKFMESLV